MTKQPWGPEDPATLLSEAIRTVEDRRGDYLDLDILGRTLRRMFLEASRRIQDADSQGVEPDDLVTEVVILAKLIRVEDGD